MKGAGRVRITIEMLDQGGEPAVIEMDDITIVQEAGINRHHPVDSPAANLSHNGQHRVEIKAWKGCPTFESFQAETQTDESLLGSLMEGLRGKKG